MNRAGATLGLALALAGPADAAEAPAINGYLKAFGSATDVRDHARRLGYADEAHAFDHADRLRLRMDVRPSDQVSMGAHYDVYVQWGDSVRIRRRSGAPPPAERRRFLDLESDIRDEDSMRARHGLDRLWIRWEPDRRVQLTAGRQAVSWGTGLIWSPTDLFSAFAPTEIDREEKLGVDAVRLIVQAHPLVSVDAVVEPLDRDAHGRATARDSTFAARIGTRAGEYDLHLCAGSVQSDAVLGGDFSGYLGDAGFRGEALYTWVDERDQRDYVRALLGADYGFAAPWNPYVAVEYFHNGLGARDEGDYAARRMASSVRRVFERGIAYNLGREYLAGTLRVQPNALLTLQATTLVNLRDGSFREFAACTWSVTEDFDVMVGVDAGLGGGRGEFTRLRDETTGMELGVPDLYFMYAKYYF